MKLHIYFLILLSSTFACKSMRNSESIDQSNVKSLGDSESSCRFANHSMLLEVNTGREVPIFQIEKDLPIDSKITFYRLDGFVEVSKLDNKVQIDKDKKMIFLKDSVALMSDASNNVAEPIAQLTAGKYEILRIIEGTDFNPSEYVELRLTGWFDNKIFSGRKCTDNCRFPEDTILFSQGDTSRKEVATILKDVPFDGSSKYFEIDGYLSVDQGVDNSQFKFDSGTMSVSVKKTVELISDPSNNYGVLGRVLPNTLKHPVKSLKSNGKFIHISFFGKLKNPVFSGNCNQSL